MRLEFLVGIPATGGEVFPCNIELDQVCTQYIYDDNDINTPSLTWYINSGGFQQWSRPESPTDDAETAIRSSHDANNSADDWADRDLYSINDWKDMRGYL